MTFNPFVIFENAQKEFNQSTVKRFRKDAEGEASEHQEGGDAAEITGKS